MNDASEWIGSCTLFAQVIPVLMLAGLLDPRANRGWATAQLARRQGKVTLGLGAAGEIAALIGATPAAVRPLTDSRDSVVWTVLAGIAFISVVGLLAVFCFREMDALGSAGDEE